jgi:2,4-dienoyl-CoA reductase-like NADH-dependent reductase (Old Yellow Enzyme family)
VFDAVTLHLANGCLLQTFISPYANARVDEYGGSLERRMRLPLEALHAGGREVGPAFPIICRVCVDEFIEGGLTLAEGRHVAQRLECAGADAIAVLAGIPESLHVIGPPMATPRGFLAAHAAARRGDLDGPIGRKPAPLPEPAQRPCASPPMLYHLTAGTPKTSRHRDSSGCINRHLTVIGRSPSHSTN